ncbi:MAG: 50S ribosomal protein L24 [Sphaerochaeta sp.]|jgi:large subunit ribosomal protein L24|nr:50S ribosomal protein L24 [Spirochaetales bacterium]
MKLKKNDTVVIIAGKDKGKSGKIVKIDHKKERAIVQGANMVKKSMKKTSQQDRGGIVEIEAPIHVSNLMYLTSKGEASRLGYKFDENGKKVRYAKKTGEVI